MFRNRSFLSCFMQCRNGGVLPLIGLAFGILVLSAGLTIDLTRAQIVRERLQWAVDAAALAAAREPTNALRREKALAYFRANFPEGYMGTSGGSFNVSNISTVNGRGTGLRFSVSGMNMRSYLAGAAGRLMGGVDNIRVSARADVNTMPTGPHDIVLAVDVSGSMEWYDGTGHGCLISGDWACLHPSYAGNGTRMQNAKNAMNRFINIMQGGQDIRIGIVPWDQKVNGGGVISGIGVNSNSRMLANTSNTGNAVGCTNLTTYCNRDPIRPMTFLNSNLNTVRNRVNQLQGEGNTDGALGMWWAMEMLRTSNTRNWVGWSRPVTTKSIIFITDGINTKYWAGPDTGAASDTRFAQLCNTAKNDRDISVYVLAFNLNSNSGTVVNARNMLRNCASIKKGCPTETQTGRCFWNSPSGASLNAAFEEIAKTMMTMRLVR